MSIFSIGVSALKAASLGITTTGNNIANADTAGYSRQRVQQNETVTQNTSYGYVGSGVTVETISRIYDKYLTTQLQSATAQASYYDTLSSSLTSIDNILSDSTSGVSSAMKAFFAALQTVSSNTNAADTSSRQVVLTNSKTLTETFQTYDELLAQQQEANNSEISDTAKNITSYAKQIATLNQKIIEAKGTGDEPNDLLDQRDQAVLELNKLVETQTVELDNGSINVFIGTGQALVLGSTASTFAAVSDPADSEKLSLSYTLNGNSVHLSDSTFTSGKLGALIEARDTIEDARNELGRIGLALAVTVNRQQAAGMDLNGDAGTPFFSFDTVTVGGVDVPAIGAIKTNTNNTGTASLSGYISDIGALTGSNYNVAYDGTNYIVTRASDNTKTTVTAAAMAAGTTVDGLYLQSSGTANAGDSFTIKPYEGTIRNLETVIDDPNEVAAAVSISLTTSSANTGSLAVTQPVVDTPSLVTTTAAVNAALNNGVTINFTSATAFTVTDTVTSTTTSYTYTDGMTLSMNGWSTTLSGKPAAGDTVTLGANTGAESDNRNAKALTALQTTNILSGGTQTLSDAYAAMISDVGSQTSSAKTLDTAYTTIKTTAQTARDSVSAVNTDEEAANLLAYQKAYQAASKVIQIAQETFQNILDIVG